MDRKSNFNFPDRLNGSTVNRGLGLTDNLLLVPGLVSTSRFGTDDIRLSMRGMGSRSNSGVRGVRVLYDGIPESEPDGQLDWKALKLEIWIVLKSYAAPVLRFMEMPPEV